MASNSFMHWRDVLDASEQPSIESFTSNPGSEYVYDCHRLAVCRGERRPKDGPPKQDVWMDICPGGLVFIGMGNEGGKLMRSVEDDDA